TRRSSDLFPWKDELSEGIDHTAFCLSFLRQPDLFLRIRPGHEKALLDKLGQPATMPLAPQPEAPFALPYEFIPPFTLRLPNGFKVEEWFTPDGEVVIQDYSSQKIASFLRMPDDGLHPGMSDRSIPSQPGSSPSFWDACAASGGKSILAFDLNPRIDIT